MQCMHLQHNTQPRDRGNQPKSMWQIDGAGEVQSVGTKEANFFVSLGVFFIGSTSYSGMLAMTNVKHSTTAAARVKEEIHFLY